MSVAFGHIDGSPLAPYYLVMTIAFVFLCVAVMIIAIAASPKPVGWVALSFAVLALVLALTGWPLFRVR